MNNANKKISEKTNDKSILDNGKPNYVIFKFKPWQYGANSSPHKLANENN